MISAVGRARFIPPHIWVYDDRNEPQPLDRDTDPQRWWQVVYSDTAIMTQFDNGTTVWPDPTGDHPTRSASQPSLVLDMLANLDVHDGHRVLETGTGTGYHAALLAARLGDSAVTTIEIDATVAQQARANLTAVGYTPTVITADGAAGYPAGAPYDRIIATASVRPGQLPYTWVAQTRRHAWWAKHGRPTYTRLGVTVTDTEQWAWLDHPDQRVAI